LSGTKLLIRRTNKEESKVTELREYTSEREGKQEKVE
jgi:hypothetical protein